MLFFRNTESVTKKQHYLVKTLSNEKVNDRTQAAGMDFVRPAAQYCFAVILRPLI